MNTRPPPHLPHQGRTPAQGHCGADADARHLRRAGRRPRHHRLGPHGAGPHHARRGARRARAAPAGDGGPGSLGAAGRRRRARRSCQRDAQAGRPGLRQRRVPHHRDAGGVACGGGGDGQALGLRGGRSRRCPHRARPAMSRAPMPRWRARPRRQGGGWRSSAAGSFRSRSATGTGAAGATRNMHWPWRSRWQGVPGISALAADTDGIDGGSGQVTDPAGAMVDAGTLAGRAPPGRPEVPR